MVCFRKGMDTFKPTKVNILLTLLISAHNNFLFMYFNIALILKLKTTSHELIYTSIYTSIFYYNPQTQIRNSGGNFVRNHCL